MALLWREPDQQSEERVLMDSDVERLARKLEPLFTRLGEIGASGTLDEHDWQEICSIHEKIDEIGRSEDE